MVSVYPLFPPSTNRFIGSIYTLSEIYFSQRSLAWQLKEITFTCCVSFCLSSSPKSMYATWLIECCNNFNPYSCYLLSTSRFSRFLKLCSRRVFFSFDLLAFNKTRAQEKKKGAKSRLTKHQSKNFFSFLWKINKLRNWLLAKVFSFLTRNNSY